MKKKIYLKARSSAPRIDQFLAEHIRDLSRSRIEKLIMEGSVTLNGRTLKRKNHPVVPGDRLEVLLEQKADPSEVSVPSQKLNKIFEDDWILIIEKPTGISVHPGAGEREETVLDRFRYEYPQIDSMTEKERPGLVHRLDKDTSGLLLLAKTEKAMVRLQKQFKRREVDKTYLALVNGEFPLRQGTIDAPLARDLRNRTKFKALVHEERENMREAVTHYWVVKQWPGFAWVRITMETGRTHQIRVHMASTGHAVLGDRIYGGRKEKQFPRLALHAHRLQFTHPITGMEIKAFSPFPLLLRRFMASKLQKI